VTDPSARVGGDRTVANLRRRSGHGLVTDGIDDLAVAARDLDEIRAEFGVTPPAGPT
jgi:hypothetical protein